VPARPLTVTLTTQSLSDCVRVCTRESRTTPESAPVPEQPKTALLQAAAGYPYITGLPLGASKRTARRYTPPVAVAVDVFVPPDVFEGFFVTNVFVSRPRESDIR